MSPLKGVWFSILCDFSQSDKPLCHPFTCFLHARLFRFPFSLRIPSDSDLTSFTERHLCLFSYFSFARIGVHDSARHFLRLEIIRIRAQSWPREMRFHHGKVPGDNSFDTRRCTPCQRHNHPNQAKGQSFRRPPAGARLSSWISRRR